MTLLGIFIPSVDATMISLKIVDTTEVPVLIVLVLTLLRDPTLIFWSLSAAAIKQLQAKQKYGLAFYQPNLHFVKKKFCGPHFFTLQFS